MNAQGVFEALKSHYKQTGEVMDMETFKSEVVTKTETKAALIGVLDFDEWLEKRHGEKS